MAASAQTVYGGDGWTGHLCKSESSRKGLSSAGVGPMKRQRSTSGCQTCWRITRGPFASTIDYRLSGWRWLVLNMTPTRTEPTMQTTRRGLAALVNRNSRIVLSTNNRSSSPINMMPAKLVDQTGGSGNPILNTPPPMPHPRLRRAWLSPVCPVSASSFLRPSRPSASGPCSCPSDHPCLPLNVSLVAGTRVRIARLVDGLAIRPS